MLSAGYVALCYIFLSLSGIALNIFVLCRLCILAKRKRVLFMTGCGLPLAAMTAADLLSLVSAVGSIFFPLFVAMYDPSSVIKDWHCKLSVFTLHTMTTVSIWCWLFASLMRYVAVYHPHIHLSRWRLGCKSLLVVVLISAVMNSWIPITTASEEDYCYQRSLIDQIDINNILLFIDILWSYVLPVVITLVLDVRVMLKPPPGFERSSLESSKNDSNVSARASFFDWRPRAFSKNRTVKSPVKQTDTKEQSENNTNINKDGKVVLADEKESLMSNGKPPSSRPSLSRSARARSNIAYWLLITTVKLLIVTPDSVLRLVSFFCDCAIVKDPSSTMHLVVIIARMLYYVQFWSNAAYLTTVLRNGDAKMRRQRECELTNGNNKSVNSNPYVVSSMCTSPVN